MQLISIMAQISGSGDHPEQSIEMPTQEELDRWVDDSDPTLDGYDPTVPNLTTLEGETPGTKNGYDPYDTAVLRHKK